jgi:hypothetical protein
MPSLMIHLFTAYEVNKKGSDLFWIGNFAPDYINDRVLKDKVHFRDSVNRLESIDKLKKEINHDNQFELGWLLHLFVDYYWDEKMISAFKEKYRVDEISNEWFIKYREETSLASYCLYHKYDWSIKIWKQIIKADLSAINSKLPVTKSDIEPYIERVYKKHSESDSKSASKEYSEDIIIDFVKITAKKYIEWISNE